MSQFDTRVLCTLVLIGCLTTSFQPAAACPAALQFFCLYPTCMLIRQLTNCIPMSKWNKPALSQEFLENEDRRKLMIVEAARRRKEKMLQIQQQEEAARKTVQLALETHKQLKQQTYAKYLRSNNMHDKYEAIKREAKQSKEPILPAGKWNKALQKQEGKSELQKKEVRQYEPKPKSGKGTLAAQFERDWEDEQKNNEMMGSRLLDSLDLDIGTIHRDQELSFLLKEQEEKKKSPNAVDQMRDIIGYESILFSVPQKNVSKPPQATQKKLQKKKEEREGEKMMIELKNQQASKLLHWAIEEEQDAEDLFSNCSSKVSQRKKSKQTVKSNQTLTPIKEVTDQTIKEVSKRSSVDRSEKTKSGSKPDKQTQKEYPKPPPGANKTMQISSKRSSSRQRVPTENGFKKAGKVCSAEVHIPAQRQKSKQSTLQPTKQGAKKRKKEQNKEQKREQARQGTLATQEEYFEIEEFIANQLVGLNEEELKLQNEIKVLHSTNKQNLRQVVAKYDIKTDYEFSHQLTGAQAPPQKSVQNEDDIEESIQRLDDLLIKKNIDKKQNIVPPPNGVQPVKTRINPLCNPFQLHAQVLQLADNISKMNMVEGEGGYAARHKVKLQKEKMEVAGSIGVGDIGVGETESQVVEPLVSPPEMYYELSNGNEKIQVNEKLRKLLMDD